MDEEHSRGTMEAVDESNSDLRSFHEHDDARQAMENCNLIVNYLPHDIDDLALKGLFVEFGEIVSAKVVTDRNTKKSLGYGFVKFLCEDDAKLAIQRLNGFTIDNKCLKVSVARPASLEIRNCKLYVTNLPKDYTEIDVIHLFQEFGDIIECRVLKDRNSRTNKGVAFVQFDNKSQANNALSLNGCQLEGGQRGLVVKYAEDQHKKREMDRLQNLTTHNVYRYLPLAPGGASGSGEDMGMGGGFRPQDPSEQMSPGYYYSNSLSGSGSGSGSAKGMSPHYPSATLQVPMHPHGQQSPHMPQHHLPAHQQHQQHMQSPVQPPPPHPSPVQQHHHSVHTHQGLGGINAIFNGASPLQMGLSMQPPSGMVPVSPIMGAVSPNHFYYQQQQLLQQQMGVNMTGSTSPRMFVYSPTAGMRRAIKGRGMGAGGDPGGGGGGGGANKQYPTVDISLLTSDQAPSPIHQHQQQQQQQQQQFHYQNPQQHPQQGGYGGGYYSGAGGSGVAGQQQQGRAVPGVADFGMMNTHQQQQGRQPQQQGAPHPQYQNTMPPRSPVMHNAPMRMPAGMMQQPQQGQQPPQGQQHSYVPPQAQQLAQLGMHQPPQYPNSPPAQYAQSPPAQYAQSPPVQYATLPPQLQGQGQGQGQGHMGYGPVPSRAQIHGHQQQVSYTSSPPQRYAGDPVAAGNSNSNVNNSGGNNNNGVAGVTLLVSNLPAHVDEAMLHAMFAPFRLLSAQIDDIDSTANNIHHTNTNTNTNTHNTNTNTNNTITSDSSINSNLGRARVQVAGMHQAESAVQAVHNCCFQSDVPVQVSIAGSNFE